jgi:predicted RNA-binding Zn ribbon-like protein
VAGDAIERFADDAPRLTRCSLPSCGALLLSRSRSDARRWCSMELCGNRFKVAAHRERRRPDRQ